MTPASPLSAPLVLLAPGRTSSTSPALIGRRGGEDASLALRRPGSTRLSLRSRDERLHLGVEASRAGQVLLSIDRTLSLVLEPA
jgi:hypothetical protein